MWLDATFPSEMVLTPANVCASVPVSGPENGSVDRWVCMHCVDREDAYDTCRCCGDAIVYRAQRSTLNA